MLLYTFQLSLFIILTVSMYNDCSGMCLGRVGYAEHALLYFTSFFDVPVSRWGGRKACQNSREADILHSCKLSANEYMRRRRGGREGLPGWYRN